MLDVAKRAFSKFQDDRMMDHAASLTYFLMMSLFPALLVIISLLGIFGDRTLVTHAVEYARDQGAPSEVTDAIRSSLQGTVDAGGAVSFALLVGLVTALYGASGAFGGAGRALNTVFNLDEDRPFVRHKLEDLACTFIVITLALVAIVSVFLGGGLADDIFDTIGLGSTFAAVWRVARWAVALAAMMGIYAFVYAYAPNRPRDERDVLWFSPGAVTGVVIWLVASLGFFFYVANFAKYGATYGAFAGAVILLLWLYLTNLAFLFGAEVNAEIERGQLAARHGPPPPSMPPTAEHPVPGSRPAPEGAEV